MKPHRRQILLGGGALALAACTSGEIGGAATAQEFDGEALHADVRRYVDLATKTDGHRTGTPADLATLDWLEARLQGADYALERLETPIAVHRPDRAQVIVDGRVIEGFPQWPVIWTGPRGLTMPLVLVPDPSQAGAAKDALALIRFPYFRASSMALPAYGEAIRALRAAGAKGVVIITEGPTGDIIAMNAPASLPPFGLPMLLVGPRQAPPVIEAARARKTAMLTIAGSDAPGVARTLVGRIARGPKHIVVSTPASGWFACGGERGPGIALWLAFAEALARRSTASLVFVANSGHEIGDLGAHQFLIKAAPAKESVALWLHLGAGIATYDWHEANPLRRLPNPDPQRYLLASQPLADVARAAFKGQPGLEQVYEATVAQAAGELRPILAAGYDRAVGIFAGHRFHHVPSDDATKTGPELLAPVARALLQIIRFAEKDAT